MRRRAWIWVAVAATAVVSLALLLLSFVHPTQLRERMETFLTERLDSDVAMREFGAHPLPTLSVDGAGLVLRRHNDAAPFIEIDTFEALRSVSPAAPHTVGQTDRRRHSRRAGPGRHGWHGRERRE